MGPSDAEKVALTGKKSFRLFQEETFLEQIEKKSLNHYIYLY